MPFEVDVPRVQDFADGQSSDPLSLQQQSLGHWPSRPLLHVGWVVGLTWLRLCTAEPLAQWAKFKSDVWVKVCGYLINGPRRLPT